MESNVGERTTCDFIVTQPEPETMSCHVILMNLLHQELLLRMSDLRFPLPDLLSASTHHTHREKESKQSLEEKPVQHCGPGREER
jgi:hypothetical protein